MRKTCIVCNKVWTVGDPTDGLISHGVCEGDCEAVYTVWLMGQQSMKLRDFYLKHRDNMADILHEFRQVA